MSVKRRSVDVAWPGALLACAVAAVACGEDPETPFVTGGGRDHRDAGNDDDTDGGPGGQGGGGGGVGGGSTDDPFADFTSDKWVAGDPTGLDPEKVYIVLENEAVGADILDLAYPGGDPEIDTGRKLLSDESHFDDEPGAVGAYPSVRMRADGALIWRPTSSVYVVNAGAGDVKIAKCATGSSGDWLLHPRLGSVIYQCRTEETEKVKLYYQSITAIGENIDYYREHIYPIPDGYTPFLVGPEGDLLLRKKGCESTGCTEYYVAHDDELIEVALPSTYFYSRTVFFRNTDGGFHLLVHQENFFDVPPLPDPLPEPGVVLDPMYYQPVALQLWKITYEGEITKVHDYKDLPYIANNCGDGPEQVIYPVDDITGYVDYTQMPLRRQNHCHCALAWDGSGVCSSGTSAYYMSLDGSNGLFYARDEPDGYIQMLVTGP